MLQELFIKNFAIIDDLHIRFSGRLTILSGETGAGKSIIIQAVNLLLGSRADAGAIRTGADTAELEVFFQITPGTRVADLLKAHDYDDSDRLGIKRIISRNDRHKTYVNGRIATVRLLNLITENLASISGQHAHQSLLKEEQHLMVLDQFGGLLGLREEAGSVYHEILPLIREFHALKAMKARQAQQIDMLEFQRNEITEAAVIIGEDAELEREKAILKNGEMLYQAVYSGIEELYSAQNAIVERLVEVKKRLEKACEIDPELCSRAQDLDDTTFRIEDIVEDLRVYLNNIQLDETRIQYVEDRLDTLQKLKRKYGGSLESVLSHLESVEEELAGVENLSEKLTEIEADLSDLQTRLITLTSELSEKRRETADVLARKMEKELETLKMTQTKFEIRLEPIPSIEGTDPYLITETGAISETGTDRATFMISPNVGESLRPLANIASGGELSRTVLALKAILVQTESVETVIFDEVDAGIGGGTAEVVGRKLASLADYHQVICITHLPQIAKFGDHHFRISKHISGGRTRTIIEPLNEDERVREIARMLGGSKMTRVSLDHASEMLRNP